MAVAAPQSKANEVFGAIDALPLDDLKGLARLWFQIEKVPVNPSSADLLLARAAVSLRRGDYKAAITDIDRVFQWRKTLEFESLFNLNSCLVHSGLFDQSYVVMLQLAKHWTDQLRANGRHSIQQYFYITGRFDIYQLLWPSDDIESLGAQYPLFSSLFSSIDTNQGQESLSLALQKQQNSAVRIAGSKLAHVEPAVLQDESGYMSVNISLWCFGETEEIRAMSNSLFDEMYQYWTSRGVYRNPLTEFLSVSFRKIA